MPVTVAYDEQLARVRITASSVTGASAVVERSTNQIRWTTVRGGSGVAVTGGAVRLDDYEFAPGVPNWYRVRGTNSQTAVITPVITRVWLKSLARPFLNRPVIVSDVSEVTRAARSGIHQVIGRSLPVAVHDVRAGRQWSMTVLTRTDSDRQAIDMLIASSDTLLVQVPAGSRVPSGYVQVGDTSQQLHAEDPLSVTTLPLTEVAPPGPDVVGATVTWRSVLNTYATWADLRAAHASWASVLELIGDPQDVIVQ